MMARASPSRPTTAGRRGGGSRSKRKDLDLLHKERRPRHDRRRQERIWKRRETILHREARAVLVLVVAAALSLLLAGCGQRSQLSVTIAGRVEQIREGTTLAEAAAIFQLRPRAGNLLDVQGRLLRVAAFPGWLLLNGERAPGVTRLRDRDRVELAHGRDRTERLTRESVPVPGGRPNDPQFSLARMSGVEVVTASVLTETAGYAGLRSRCGC